MNKSENKTGIVTIRLTKTQLKCLDATASAANLSRSAFIVRAATGKNVLPPRVPPINWQLYAQLQDLATSLRAIALVLSQTDRKQRGESLFSSAANSDDLESALALIQTTGEKLTEVQLALSGVKRAIENNY